MFNNDTSISMPIPIPFPVGTTFHGSSFTRTLPPFARTVSDFHTIPTTARIPITRRIGIPPPPGFEHMYNANAKPNSENKSFFDLSDEEKTIPNRPFPFEEYFAKAEGLKEGLKEGVKEGVKEEDDDEEEFPKFPTLSMKAVNKIQEEITLSISPMKEKPSRVSSPWSPSSQSSPWSPSLYYVDDKRDDKPHDKHHDKRNNDNSMNWLYEDTNDLSEPFGEFKDYNTFCNYVSNVSMKGLM